MSFHKTISMTLDPHSIQNAIREIRDFKKQLTDCCSELARKLTEEGVVVAKMNVMHMNAVYTGHLEESIKGVYFPQEHLGVVFTDVPYALFVEYGTGIVGENSQHPEAGEIEWEYDVHNHGESGWWYFTDTDGNKRFRWTKGQPSRPYMYETLRWLEQNAAGIAAEAFNVR